nr:hypothetical protein CFP56_02779 [Quercus suber]POF13756.1 hypothetical protein CFP56_02780 [Quercus suber]
MSKIKVSTNVKSRNWVCREICRETYVCVPRHPVFHDAGTDVTVHTSHSTVLDPTLELCEWTAHAVGPADCVNSRLTDLH